jgi:trimethylamine--corrinoid protein Co-methyltransferase
MKPTLKYLSDREIRLIHESAFKILEAVGVKMPHEEALTLWSQAGASVDGDVVKIPARLVEKALETSPKRDQVALYGLDSKHDISFTSHEPRAAAMCMAVSVLDLETGEHRSAGMEDLVRQTWLLEQLPNIEVNGGLVTPQDVPGQFNDWYTWAGTIKNTTKHVTGGMYGAQCVRDAMAMGALAAGGMEHFKKRPHLSGWVLTLPTLGNDYAGLDALMEMARQNVVVILSSGPMLGASSPMSLAGSVAQAHAEMLAGITLMQLVNPGAPLVYTSFIRSMNMKTMAVCMASPESGIMRGAMAEMGHFLGLPVRMPGLLRDSKILDAQAGFETALTGLTLAYNCDLMDSGQLDSDLLVDYADPIFINEAMYAIKRSVRELAVNEKTINLDHIAAIGPGGSFLTTNETVRNFRKEVWHSTLFEQGARDVWVKQGSLDIRERALNQARRILAERQSHLMPPEVCRRIDDLIPTS